MSATGRETILLVDDDPQIRELFESFLEIEYRLELAESGPAAIEVMADHIDACLIDRRMPDMAGEDVVRQFREAGYKQPIAMVTAVEPDINVIEMGFDDYLVKPVAEEELLDLVQSLLLRQEYDEILREYFALASKIAVLKSSKGSEALSSNSEYNRAIDNLTGIKKEAKHSLDAAIDDGMLEELLWNAFLEGQLVGSSPAD